MATTADFHKILVPYDFSDTSREALALGRAMARRYGAALTILHVYEPPFYPTPDGMLRASAEVMAKQVVEINGELEALGKEIEAQGTSVHTLIAQGTPHAEILRELKDGGHELAVMGTHGRSGWRHAILGSVAERVLREATCPVLTVRLPKP